MPSSLLRALTNRSTPTLASERNERQKNMRMVLTPSIFVTLPLEEGGHFWCVLPGSACPLPLPRPPTPTANTPSGSNSSFDAPIPDIAAIEETVDRLRRAGETPTFRRPSRANEVVLPKKKYVHAHGHDHRHGFEDSMSVSTMGRSTPEDGKKKRKSRPPPLTSISYESIVSQPFSPSSPEAFHVSMPRDTEAKPKEKKRNSLGWIFSSSKRSTVRKDNNMGSVLESEQFEAQFAVRREDEEVTLDQVMESTLPNSPGAESTHTTATFESDLHKPLPPLPPTKSISQQLQDSQGDEDLTLTRHRSRGLPSEPVEEQQQQKDSNESTRPSTPSKIKRKFSLKKLRERFISSPAPPVPELPNVAFTQAGNNKPTSTAIAGIASVSPEGPIDPPFTPPPIPSLDSVPREFPVISSIEVVGAIESASSGPIDPPFTPPHFVPESESSSHALETETVIAVPLLLKDDETEQDLSTASEDSTNTSGTSSGGSSTTSTPESSPPDTPANVDFGPIFGMDQVAAKLPLDLLPAAVMEKKIEQAVVLNEGMTRSNGYRTKLASMHFDQIEFDTSAF